MKTTLMSLTLAAALGLATALPAQVTIPRPESRQELRETSPPARFGSAPAAATASTGDYAQRERQAKDLESFIGGRHEDVLIIGCSCVVVVLIVLILI